MSRNILIQRKRDFMYNIHYDVCAILVLMAELVMFYTRKNMRAGHNKIYMDDLCVADFHDVRFSVRNNGEFR